MVAAVRSLHAQLSQLGKVLAQVKTLQVGSRAVREQTRAIVDEYFRSLRPGLSEEASLVELLNHLDAVMHALLDCTHMYTTTRRYRQLTKESAGILLDIEKTVLLLGTRNDRPPGIDTVDSTIIETLSRLVPAAALSYEQALRDLTGSERLSWRGPATDLREALRVTLDHLAPDAEVVAQPGYRPEKDTTGPTMRQKARFILSRRGLPRTALDAPEQAVQAVDETLSSFVRSVYGRSNISTHTPTDKDEVLRVRALVRVALCELLEIRV
jgi:hypothetical protein